MEIVNLDKMIPEDRKFILGGKEYTVPGRMPVEKAILLPNLLRKAASADNMESLKDILHAVWDVLAHVNKDKKFEMFYGAITIEMLPALMAVLLNQQLPKVKESEEINLSKKNSGTSPES